MMDRDELTRRMIENDADTLRAERNAAQRRAAQAERERDEARAVIDRAIEILKTPFGPEEEHWQHQMANEHDLVNNLLTDFRKPYYTAPQAQPAWVPQTGAEIAAAIGDKPILPADFDIDRAPTVKADAPRQHKFVEVPGHVHWLFVNWPKYENDGEFLEACLRNYNQWIDDGYTDVKHFPMGDGKLLIEFRKPEVSA